MPLTLVSDWLQRCACKASCSSIAAMMIALFSITAHAQLSTNDDLLNTLRDNGTITQEQYEALKKHPQQGANGDLLKTLRDNNAITQEQYEALEKKEEAKAQAAKEEGGGVKLKVGGFIEGAGIFRSRNEIADVNSSYNGGIPLPSNPNYNIPETRGSARQSRLSLLATGDADKDTALAAYFETDFLGTGVTSNSNESNSYVLRVRQAYATYERSDWGMYFLFGQTWSLLTMDKVDITPRQENIPYTIDAQYTVGFNWDRNMQFRAVKDWGHGFSLGLSLESAQAIIAADKVPTNAGTISTCGAAICFANPGGSGGLLNNGAAFPSTSPLATYTTNYLPDVVIKGALDPGYGHYELYAVGRAFSDNIAGSNHTSYGGGIGGSTILPLIAKKLDFQASFLWGEGIGRYGSAQLPDATIKPNGELQPVPGLDWLVGLVAHPNPSLDLYLYGGQERVSQASYGTFGYGTSNVDTKDCFAGPAVVYTSCKADTSSVWQIQLGDWWKFYQGKAGMMEVGASYSYVHRDNFAGTGGAPSTNDNIVMLSFRYYPFQPVPAAYLQH